jgi:Zn-finger in ubiquitin-hydrolases and other protein
MKTCIQLDHVRSITELPEFVEGYEGCLAVESKWLHLRICLACGHIGCCDDSLNRHNSAHAASASHPIIRSLQPGEDWSWCFVGRLAMLIPRYMTVLESRRRRWHRSRA